MRFCLIFFLGVSLLLEAGAQESRFRLHDLGDPYEGQPVHALLQDHECMIWMGTAKGLLRYDGMSAHPVTFQDSGKVLEVTSLYEDGAKTIWIGTASGTLYYLDDSRQPHLFTMDEGHPTKTITSIQQDINGNLWFATYGEGAYVYSGKRLFNFNVDDGVSGNDIYAMSCTPSGDVWMGTDDGITICSIEGEKKKIRTLGLKDGLPDQIITALETDAKGNVWIGTFEKGVVRYDAGLQSIHRPFELNVSDEITAFTIFDQKEIWIGTHASGVWRYGPGDAFPRQIENLSRHNEITVASLLSDVEGNIWLGSAQGMLLSAFRPFELLQVDVPDIQTLYCDRADQVWVGTKNGLFRLEQQRTMESKAIRVLPDLELNVTDLYEDRFNNIWIGTIDKGLFVYHPKRNRVKHIGSIIEKGGITIMSMDASSEDIWIATLEGVVSYPVNQNILERQDNGFHLLQDPWQSNLHFVFHVFVDSRDRIWFATDGNGVYCKQGHEIHHFTGEDDLEIQTVYSICEDQRGYLWFNTPDQGLIEFNGNEFHGIGLQEGLGSLNISSIMTSGTGDILVAHHQGIDLMEPDRRHFMYFAEEAGVKGIEPGLNAVTRDSKGHVYLSGKNTILKYFASDDELSIHPRTQITAVSVFNRPVDFKQVNRFSYAENLISFDYVGLWYTSPSSVKYQYTLEGYDIRWKESRDNSASYSNLRPGTYTFHVKASENNFFLDEPTASYTFTIGSPFWWKWWFIGLVVASGGGSLFWLIKSRERRSERQALLKKEMIESQLSALKAQINPHFLFNSFNTLITIIDENARNPGIAIEYVEKLSDFYRSILQYREQEMISLEEEWTLVQNFMYLLEKRYENHLRVHMDPPPKDAFIFPLTLQMLVENAVKHNIISERHPLDLYITIDPDGYVSVKNNHQPKSRTEPSTQFGLQSIIKRYQLLSDKKVVIENTPETFIVRIPIIIKSTA